MSPQKIYAEWIKANNVPNYIKNEIKKYSKSEIETYFKNEKLHFGTAGIRGIIGGGTNKMNIFTYMQMTVGYAKYLKKHFPKNTTVIIGHDNRILGEEFTYACASVLTSFNIKVLLFKNNHLTPTPIVSYAIRKLKTDGGIIITASHNPKNYNGYKVYNPDGSQILPKVANEIEKLMPTCEELLTLSYTLKQNKLSFINEKIITSYLKDAQKVIVNKKIINVKKNYPVIITTHHGTASSYLPKFLKNFNFNINPVKEQCYPDCNFTNSPSSNPEFFDSFKKSIELANKKKAKILIGVDPDADRMAVMIKHNNKWTLLTGNQMGIIFTYYLLTNKKYINPYIISSYVSTNYIDKIAKKYGVKIYRTGTGFKWMGNLITTKGDNNQLVVAFEEAIGALPTSINRDKDSFTSSALALEIDYICRKNNMDLLDYLEKVIFTKFGSWFGKTESFTINDLNWKNIAKNKMRFFTNYKNENICDYQIKKIQFNKTGNCLEWLLSNDSWIKFRMSGTEPKFKIYYELNGDNLEKLQSDYNKMNKELSDLFYK